MRKLIWAIILLFWLLALPSGLPDVKVTAQQASGSFRTRNRPLSQFVPGRSFSINPLALIANLLKGSVPLKKDQVSGTDSFENLRRAVTLLFSLTVAIQLPMIPETSLCR
jgi:hypothetical protein